MPMAAATRMGGGSAHSPSSASISLPPWHPVVLAPNQHHQALHDLDLIVAPSPSPSPTTPTTPQRLRPTARRAGKQRRPRPSRKLPTTYISADAASFRRMVHQVTGADDVVYHQAAPELLCRPAPAPPSRAALTTTTTATLLPTLDTSAFLLGAARGGGAPPARPGGACYHGSAVPAAGVPGAALQVEVAEQACGGVRGGGEEYSCSNGSGGGGFPSLESWDGDALF
ncbi:unnamed protein product [Miscanthus lutarioriparius]|uniref:VQ domain-containing protein n=1 Tax=Miscanthus lutarioriparius TaxID=422564 RepID=A0A811RJX4_9POAL|nr:unnamed protein product [Miscanthus lutarioriparius]